MNNDLMIGDKTSIEVVLLDEIVYGVEPRYYYDDGVRRIYKLIDQDMNIYVWMTSNVMGIDFIDDKGTECFETVEVGDRIILDGKVKSIGQYKGEEQIVLTRCKVKNISHDALTEEDIQDIKRDLQRCRISNVKEVKTVSYKEYKEKYNKYETVIGSFVRNDNGCFIDIIITEEMSGLYYYSE